ncbi:Transmembrane exosortase [Novipirellula aureliae]|uniref:Transmembrane exosortase n=1 Tax=Novipirellula aureliae TaxID=2527966 RepID=A0A5C6DXC6_9BACT|nr:exosortase/archaeosortase family protein [Novipirellula aureliae]TWU41308.1 Transmembrane exosortase [Novipirellula aureliae]
MQETTQLGSVPSAIRSLWKPALWFLPIAITILWTYSSELLRLATQWWQDPDYIHGFLVIPFAVYLSYRRRNMVDWKRVQGSVWGLALIGLAIAMQCVSAYMTDPLLTPLSIPVCLAGILLFLGGKEVIGWLWPSLVVLLLMIPLPDFMSSWGNLALQRVATVASTFLLQVFGVPAASFGNVIVLTNTELGVEEACSGLRSTVLFMAVSVCAAMVVKGVPERIVVILAAIPAAILSNVIRIVATGLLYQYSDAEFAEAVFHDFFGFLMLPLATAMVWAVVRLTQAILIPQPTDVPLQFGDADFTAHTVA